MRKHNHFAMLYFSKTQISVCGDGDVDDAVELKCEKKTTNHLFSSNYKYKIMYYNGEFTPFELAIFEDQLYIIIVQMKNTHTPFCPK